MYTRRTVQISYCEVQQHNSISILSLMVLWVRLQILLLRLVRQLLHYKCTILQRVRQKGHVLFQSDLLE